jgi:hypothetical protein
MEPFPVSFKYSYIKLRHTTEIGCKLTADTEKDKNSKIVSVLTECKICNGSCSTHPCHGHICTISI